MSGKKRARRSRRGEGTIVQLGPDRWRAQVSLGVNRVTGRRERWSHTASTWEEANQERARFIASGVAGRVDRSMTLAQFLPAWAAKVRDNERTHFIRLDKIAPVIRHLGDVKVAELTRGQLFKFLNSTLKDEPRPGVSRPLAPRTRKHIRDVLRSALQYAWDIDEIVSENVAARLKIVGLREDDFDPYVLSLDEYRAFLEAVSEADMGRLDAARRKGMVTTTLRALWTFLLEHGCRSGEVLGLQWRHIDLVRGTVRVEQQLQRKRGGGSTKGKPRGHGERLELVRLKTVMGRRTITLDPASLAAFRAHRQHQREAGSMLGADWNQLDLVFPTINGNPMQGSALDQFFEDVCRRAGIRPSSSKARGVRIHDLRHTAATYQLVKLRSIREVQVMLGHSTVKMTERYLHLIPTAQRRQIA